jgi:hypothetical protein
MRAIAFAIVLAAMFLVPSVEWQQATPTTKQIMSTIAFFSLIGFVVCVLGGV